MARIHRTSSWMLNYLVSRLILTCAIVIVLGTLAIVFLFIIAPFATAPYFYVAFVGETGWIVGEKCWRTADGGIRWELVEYGANYWDEIYPAQARNRVSLSSEGILYDSFGRFRYRTRFPQRLFASTRVEREEGERPFSLRRDMRPVSGPVDERDVYRVFVRDSELGLIVDSNSNVYRLHPKTGEIEQTNLPRRPFAAAFPGQGGVYALVYGEVWRSLDQGLFWDLVETFPGSLRQLYVWEDRLWVLGERGLCFVFDLQNGGHQRVELPTPLVGFLLEPASLVDMTAYGETALILDTASNGYVFQLGSDGLPEGIERVKIAEVPIYSLAVNDSGVAYAVGGGWPNILGLGGSADAFVSEDFRNWRRLELR